MTIATVRQTLARMTLGAIAVVLLAATTPGTVRAQNLFAPVAEVDGAVVTAYERNQRVLMLQLFRAPGDLQEEALQSLIDERLQLREAKRLGLTVTPAEIETGMEEFAGRANLTREEFIKALASAGVGEESFRDFVGAGLAWRKVVRERFAGRIEVSEQDVNRAVRQGDSTSSIRVLLSEIILPARTPEEQAAAQRRAAEVARITTLPAFAAAARKYSGSPSRGRGGRIDWIPYANLPPAIAGQVLGLSVGQVTPPVPIANAIALFQLRAIEETGVNTAGNPDLEYAAFFIPGAGTEAGRTEAARVRARVDTCDDLYTVAKDLPASRLERVTRATSDIPSDIALELAKLDPGEVSTALRSAGGQTTIFLMLCDRKPQGADDVNLGAVRESIINRRLSSSADALLAELKANATIRIQ
ncbi:peptidyl-prolyl cis-trans isomerase [Oceaniglobus indicus]|uniref:peptidyl-prolyl cis-trans isomerase n=1 Tax=Oceaniglobus indicus TaxID=2047749 RepID=UPI000C18651F|nr:peptidyl-prolyl cis-trans isomerase [Oceaniglobus indicus]